MMLAKFAVGLEDAAGLAHDPYRCSRGNLPATGFKEGDLCRSQFGPVLLVGGELILLL